MTTLWCLPRNRCRTTVLKNRSNVQHPADSTSAPSGCPRYRETPYSQVLSFQSEWYTSGGSASRMPQRSKQLHMRTVSLEHLNQLVKQDKPPPEAYNQTKRSWLKKQNAQNENYRPQDCPASVECWYGLRSITASILVTVKQHKRLVRSRRLSIGPVGFPRGSTMTRPKVNAPLSCRVQQQLPNAFRYLESAGPRRRAWQRRSHSGSHGNVRSQRCTTGGL